MIDFKSRALPSIVARDNAMCLNCHKKSALTHWQGSVHDNGQTRCTDCHSIHVTNDPINTPVGQLNRCGTCHGSAKNQHKRFSNHPIAKGKMSCTDCHAAHDSHQQNLLHGDSINESCYSCHAAKRGPFLWEHSVVGEDCTLCHNPHGSNHPDMLKQRAPMLCQQCHGASGHSGFMPTLNAGGQVLPSVFVIGKSCLNCHSKVHGSNHPGGEKLQR
jgi:DmsE family decaheme c-type cytochrome